MTDFNHLSQLDVICLNSEPEMNTTEETFSSLFDYIKEIEKENCKYCGCTKDIHFCDFNAYIDEYGTLLDVNEIYNNQDTIYATIKLPMKVADYKELQEEILHQVECFNINLNLENQANWRD
jgi:hypothetical protein